MPSSFDDANTTFIDAQKLFFSSQFGEAITHFQSAAIKFANALRESRQGSSELTPEQGKQAIANINKCNFFQIKIHVLLNDFVNAREMALDMQIKAQTYRPHDVRLHTTIKEYFQFIAEKEAEFRNKYNPAFSAASGMDQKTLNRGTSEFNSGQQAIFAKLIPTVGPAVSSAVTVTAAAGTCSPQHPPVMVLQSAKDVFVQALKYYCRDEMTQAEILFQQAVGLFLVKLNDRDRKLDATQDEDIIEKIKQCKLCMIDIHIFLKRYDVAEELCGKITRDPGENFSDAEFIKRVACSAILALQCKDADEIMRSIVPSAAVDPKMHELEFYPHLQKLYKQLKILRVYGQTKEKMQHCLEIIAALRKFKNPSDNILRLLRDASLELGNLNFEFGKQRPEIAEANYHDAQYDNKRIKFLNSEDIERGTMIAMQLATAATRVAPLFTTVGAFVTTFGSGVTHMLAVRTAPAAVVASNMTVVSIEMDEKQLEIDVDQFHRNVSALTETNNPPAQLELLYQTIIAKLLISQNPSDAIKRHLRNIYMDWGDLCLNAGNEATALEKYAKARNWNDQITAWNEMQDGFFAAVIAEKLPEGFAQSLQPTAAMVMTNHQYKL